MCKKIPTSKENVVFVFSLGPLLSQTLPQEAVGGYCHSKGKTLCRILMNSKPLFLLLLFKNFEPEHVRRGYRDRNCFSV